MKRAWIYLAFAISAQSLIAQPATDPKLPCDPECISTVYSYMFCDGDGNFLRKCSADPNHEPGLKMYKKSIPLILCPNFDAGQHRRIYIPNSDPGDFHDVNLFVPANVPARLKEAADRWNSLCPPQGPNKEYQACCLKVVWAVTISDMREFSKAAAITYMAPAAKDPSKPGACENECSRSYIALNQDPLFTKPGNDGVPRNFFYTERENRPYIPSDYHYASLYSILLHELGHWLGFNHPDSQDGVGAVCDHPGSIMRTADITYWERQDRDLSNDDICMFKKAYCCAETANDVDEAPEVPKSLQFDIAPNPPINNILTLSLSEPIHSSAATLRIVNMSGESILGMDLAKESQHLSIDITNLSNGIYMLEILQEGAISAKKILVQR